MEDLSEDELNYKSFSQNISSSIENSLPKESFVLGLYGPWGSGKTTLLNFIEEDLETNQNIEISRFNPWWFSGERDLIINFFDHLESELSDESDELRSKLKEFGRRFARASVSAGIEAASGSKKKAIKKFLKNLIFRSESESYDINEAKDEIESYLNDLDRRIVVMIDDIDRLTNEEIRKIFKLVKTIADFPNITYVLAFDRDIVTKALSEDNGDEKVRDGSNYISKIVQLSVNLPPPGDANLREMFSKRVFEIIDHDLEEDNLDKERWEKLIYNIVSNSCQTPRDVVRLTNAFQINYNSLGNEVNMADLIALEVLRINYPKVYNIVRDEPSMFIESSNSGFLPTGPDYDKEDYDEILDHIEGPEAEVRTILSFLFPKFAELSGGLPRNEEGLHTRKRICHKDLFDIYFRLNIPEDELTRMEMEELMSKISDKEAFKTELKEMAGEELSSGNTKAYRFLDRLYDHISYDQSEVEDKDSLIKALVEVGEFLVDKDGLNDRPYQTDMRKLILQIVADIMENRAKEDNYELTKELIENTDSLFIASQLVIVLSEDFGEAGSSTVRTEDNRKVDENQLDELKKLMIDKIDSDLDESWICSPKFLRLVRFLNLWEEEYSEDMPQIDEKVKDLTQDNSTLLRFLHNLISFSDTSADGGKRVFYLDLNDVEKYLDVSEVKDRIEQMDYESLESVEKEAVDYFEEAREIRAKGDDTGMAMNWMD